MLKRYIKRDLKMPFKRVSLYRGFVGELGGDSLAGTL
jgi:hypothetical protein